MNIDMGALHAIEVDRGISVDELLDTIKSALLTAYRHTEGHQPDARIEIDRKTGAVQVIARETDAEGNLPLRPHIDAAAHQPKHRHLRQIARKRGQNEGGKRHAGNAGSQIGQQVGANRQQADDDRGRYRVLPPVFEGDVHPAADQLSRPHLEYPGDERSQKATKPRRKGGDRQTRPETEEIGAEERHRLARPANRRKHHAG